MVETLGGGFTGCTVGMPSLIRTVLTIGITVPPVIIPLKSCKHNVDFALINPPPPSLINLSGQGLLSNVRLNPGRTYY